MDSNKLAIEDADRLQAPEAHVERLNRAARHLIENLGDNLYSLVLYGSMVRGGVEEETSDINLMVVLIDSSAEAHQIVSEITQGEIIVTPFITTRSGMPRALRVFALKFLSIRRDSLLLYGQDPFENMEPSKELQVLLAEQELRSLRTKIIHGYVISGARHGDYIHLLQRTANLIMIILSDVLRCGDIPIPRHLNDCLPLFEKHFQCDISVLHQLFKLRHQSIYSGKRVCDDFHSGLIVLFNKALEWMEERWPTMPV